MADYHIKYRQKRGKNGYSEERTRLWFEEKVTIETVAYNAGKELLPLLPYFRADEFDTFTQNPVEIIIEYVVSKNLFIRKFTLKKVFFEGLLNYLDRNFTIIDNETGKTIKLNVDTNSNPIIPKVIIPNKPVNPEISVPMGGAVRKRR